jgi:glycosyltransferase involved in cell wall biosynthesis
MDLISVREVKDAVENYYAGGVLEKPPAAVKAKRKPILRIAANIKFLGGAERSVIEIAKMFIANGWCVELSPANKNTAPDIQAALPAEVTLTGHITRPCDVFLLYASDMVFNFHHERFEVFNRIDAKRKVMALTYKIGKAGSVPWTIGWDRYLFLSTALENGFLEKIDKANNKSSYYAPETKVLAPPVELEPFLKVQPDYAGDLRIVRHSSQGDKKFPECLPDIMSQCKAKFSFMPGPSRLEQQINVTKFPYQNDPGSVAAFLSKGNVFWYLLPEGYTDQGPRVIVEAMAAGLPVICEDRDGPADRVTTETGWKIDSHAEAVELINSLTPEILAEKGAAARKRAQCEFEKEKWFEAIKGE